MTGAPLPPWRVARLLIGLRLRRLSNQLATIGRGRKRRDGTKPRKRSSGLTTAFIVLAMLLTYGNLANQAVSRLMQQVEGQNAAFGPGVMHVLSVEMVLLTLAGVLMTLGSRELAQADWDLEWLVTLPVETRPLLWARLAERTASSPFGMLALWPTCTVIAWHAGLRLAAPLAGLLVALPLLALVALGRTLVDTGLRLRLSPSRLRNLQAAISVASILLFYLTISPAMAAGARFLLPIADAVPAWVRWTPPGLALQALVAPAPRDAAIATALLVVETGLSLTLGMLALRAQLSRGVAAAGSRESGRTKAAAAGRRPRREPGRWALASPVQRRELMLLARDRNFLVQTMVLPVLMVGVQWLFNGRLDSFAQVWANPRAVASGVFIVAAYGLMLSAFQTLASEGEALWLLYTFPRPIEAVLHDKAKLWSVLALIYPVLGFGGLVAFGPPLTGDTLGLIAMVMLAVPIYSAIAVALGVFGCDPLATDARQRIRPTYLYLFMLLAGLYVGAFFAPHWWQSLVSMVLVALLALALWQKARDQLPWLLDSAASPPARVSTADGLIAAMMFFVLQVMAGIALRLGAGALEGPDVLLAFVLAGAITFFCVRYSLWRVKAHDVPRVFGPRSARALAVGLAFGAGVAALGIAYLEVVGRLGLIAESERFARASGTVPQGRWLLLLGVLAAPLFEEFIFRGLIFGGLRRSMSVLPAAAASAAVFAIVHPPLAMLPVFALGLCAAFAYDRTRLLLAPIVTHAVYNAAVIGWQTTMMASGG